jgi:hypothetical protein
MTPRRAQAVKSAASEVVAVEDAQGAVEPVVLLVAAADEPSGADTELVWPLAMARVFATPLSGRVARRRAHRRPFSSAAGTIFASFSAPQK